jgi:PAS domain S-box-containing protein
MRGSRARTRATIAVRGASAGAACGAQGECVKKIPELKRGVVFASKHPLKVLCRNLEWCCMPHGRSLIFDKSALESLNLDEAVLLDNFYRSNITPLFFVKCLADLEKAITSKSTPEQLVGSLALRTPESQSCATAHHKNVLGNELARRFDLSQVLERPLVPYGERVQLGERKGIVFRRSPEEEALQRWTNHDTSKQTFKSYSAADGLPGADLGGWGACFKSPSGEMFFGGFSGGVAFHPDKVVDSPYVPPVVLNDFRLFDRPMTVGADSPLRRSIGYTRALSLSHDQNVFSLEFSALSYFNPATNRYRYKLDGLDRQWHEVGSNQRLVTYTTLPAGRYTFRVQGATSRGAWSEPGLELAVEILSPWWNTWWFRAVCVAVFVTLLGGFYRWRIQQLRRQEKQLRDVIDTIPALAFSSSPDGKNEWVNRRWVEYSGLSPEASSGSGWRSMVHPDDLDEHVKKWQMSLASGEPFENEARRRSGNGEYRWFLVRAVPLRDAHGNILKWYGTLTDIEDRKKAEQERERLRQLEADLAHVNRVSTMGQLAASLSHELKQPITAAITDTKTCLRWLTRDQPDVGEAREATLRAMKDSTRAAEIIDRLRSLYKKGAPPEHELLDVNELVGEMLVLLRSEANRYSINMRTELASELPTVTADRVQLQQVLMNLMLNGIEAMKDTGGELTIKTELGQDGQLLISVSDTGVGLPADKTEQIFNAFFTTKPQGSGMGLAISRSIIESHGGRMWANANNGRGATFQFTLPAEVKRSS